MLTGSCVRVLDHGGSLTAMRKGRAALEIPPRVLLERMRCNDKSCEDGTQAGKSGSSDR